MDRYVVYVEQAMGWVEEKSQGAAFGAAVLRYGSRVIRVQKENSTDTDERLDEERDACARWKAAHPNNDAQQDGA